MKTKGFFQLIFLLLISNIKPQSTNTNNEFNKKENTFDKIKSKLLDCDNICFNFETNCTIIYNDIIKISTEIIISSKIIENNIQNIPLEITNAFYYKAIYEYYGIISNKPNLEIALQNFIISSYFGCEKSNYKLFLLYDSDLINHIINTKEFKKILSSDPILKLITKTNYWKNFAIFENIYDNNFENLKKSIGYNFLYLSIFKKFSPALATAGMKYSYGGGVKKNCKTATKFFKETASENISKKINNDANGNFAVKRFRIESYEHITTKYNLESKELSLDQLIQQYNYYLKNEENSQNFQYINSIIYSIGRIYYYGIGIEKNDNKAIEYFEQCAKNNYGQCYGYLGELYLYKSHLNYTKALEYFNKAITYGGGTLGYNGLGYMYYYGLGVKINKKEAYNYFLKGINSITSESIWETSFLYMNMISLFIEMDEKNDDNIIKNFDMAYKYANYLTLNRRAYGVYILAMMNEYHINDKLFPCEENLLFFRISSYTNVYFANRIKLSQKLYENKNYRGTFLIQMELAYEGQEDSLTNVVALLVNKNIFKNLDYQKYLIYYFIELNLILKNYDLYFLEIAANFFYKEKNYKKAIEMNKLLINKGGGNGKEFYIAEGFFNLGIMENFGKGVIKNVTKAYEFYKKAETYEIDCKYLMLGMRIMNKLINIFNLKINEGEINENKEETEEKENKSLSKINLLSISGIGFLLFYTWFYFNLKFQE